MRQRANKGLVVKGILLLCVMLLVAVYFKGVRSAYDIAGVNYKPAFSGMSVVDIDAMHITDRFGSITLNKQPTGIWLIPERENYPSSIGMTNETLSSLSELKLLQKVDVEASQWKYFQLIDPDEATNEQIAREEVGSKIRLSGDNFEGAIIIGMLQSSNSEASLMFGDDFDGRQFVRVVGDSAVYLADHSLSYLNSLHANWLHPGWLPSRNYRSIRYVEKGRLQWEVSREDATRPYVLADTTGGEKDTIGISFDKLSHMLDYAFSSILIRDVVIDSTIKSQLDGRHYFSVTDFNGDKYRLLLGKKYQSSEQAKALNKQSTGVFRNVYAAWWRHAAIEWPERMSNKLDMPPLAHHQFLIFAEFTEKFMLDAEELVLFERVSAESL